MMQEPVIEIRDLTFSYGAGKVLEHIELAVPRGEFLGIVGPNAGGKSGSTATCANSTITEAGERPSACPTLVFT